MSDLVRGKIYSVCFLCRDFIVGQVDGRNDPALNAVFDKNPELVDRLSDCVDTEAHRFVFLAKRRFRTFRFGSSISNRIGARSQREGPD